MIKIDSRGPVFFKQKRVGIHKKHFNILKFRTMRIDTPKDTPTHLLKDPEQYITKVGKFLRKTSLDELPQIFNVLSGSMSFVGVRPEVPKYVEQYEDVYYATLLMPAGITSPASIQYKDEEKLLAECDDADKVYIEQILPEKMKYNLSYIENFGFFSDIGIMFKTVVEVAK
jgi:lipopolysaccharide/colanic/teichoic acid biosynthesis glycosyltransferase